MQLAYAGVADHPLVLVTALHHSSMAENHPLAQYPIAQTDLGWGLGAGPWNYRKVPEPDLSSLLAAAAKANTIGSVDIIDFQPQAQPSEDRHIVQDWDLKNGSWKLLAVFDGRRLRQSVRPQSSWTNSPMAPQVTRGMRP